MPCVRIPSRMLPHCHGVVLRQKYGLIHPESEWMGQRGVCPTSAILVLFFSTMYLTGVVRAVVCV